MIRFQLSLLFVLTIISNSFGQTNVKSGGVNTAGMQETKLVGTWRLVEFANLDSATSTWTYPYGKYPKGYFTYTRNGIINLNICSERPLKISEDSAKNYNMNLLHWVDSNSVGYFGTYSVDHNKSVVTHHVKGGSLPWYIDTDQPRQFILKGDTLIIGDRKTWKRILIKTD
jgi:Lipocalin-like domain